MKPPLDVGSDILAILDPTGDQLEVLRKEVQLCDAQVSLSVLRTLEGSRLPCPLCPRFEMKRTNDVVQQHFTRSHFERDRYVCSGTKQLRVIMENDLLIGRRHHRYLRRSAELLRGSVTPAPSPLLLRTDRKYRLLLAISGPTYVAVCVREGPVPVRPVGNMFYDQSFGEKLLRILLLNGTRVVKTLKNLRCEFQVVGIPVVYFLPERCKTM